MVPGRLLEAHGDMRPREMVTQTHGREGAALQCKPTRCVGQNAAYRLTRLIRQPELIGLLHFYFEAR